jgi:hypothetical protein
MMTLLLGFVLGLATPIVLDLYRDARSKHGRVELMKAEAAALASAARMSANIAFWDSTEVRHLAALLQDRYSKESDRWIAVSTPACREALTEFYVECVGYLALREHYGEQVRAALAVAEAGKETTATGYQPTSPKAEEVKTTYNNLADRADKFRAHLEREQPLFWRAWWPDRST